ncbi:hypothetical protein WDU94_014690 [Cyamophila willieti]
MVLGRGTDPPGIARVMLDFTSATQAGFLSWLITYENKPQNVIVKNNQASVIDMVEKKTNKFRSLIKPFFDDDDYFYDADESSAKHRFLSLLFTIEKKPQNVVVQNDQNTAIDMREKKIHKLRSLINPSFDDADDYSYDPADSSVKHRLFSWLTTYENKPQNVIVKNNQSTEITKNYRGLIKPSFDVDDDYYYIPHDISTSHRFLSWVFGIKKNEQNVVVENNQSSEIDLKKKNKNNDLV